MNHFLHPGFSLRRVIEGVDFGEDQVIGIVKHVVDIIFIVDVLTTYFSQFGVGEGIQLSEGSLITLHTPFYDLLHAGITHGLTDYLMTIFLPPATYRPGFRPSALIWPLV